MNEENEMIEEKKERPVYYLVTFGEEWQIKTFERKRDLTKHVVTFGIQPHSNQANAGQGILEKPDGEACIIIKGHLKILKERTPKVQPQYTVF